MCTDVPRTTFVYNDPVCFTFSVSVDVVFWLAGTVRKEVATEPRRACGSLRCPRSFIHACPAVSGKVIAALKAWNPPLPFNASSCLVEIVSFDLILVQAGLLS